MGIPRTLARRADAPPSVSKAQAPLLAEALRRGEATRNAMEDALVDYGRWILVNIFDDDAAAALDTKSENPLWVALLARAGGPTLRISRKVLYVAVEIAARDKRINDDIWRGLEPGRKELLLPLADEAKMRKAAKHVVEMKLSQDKTREYVTELRAADGDAPKLRVTLKRVASRVQLSHRRGRYGGAARHAPGGGWCVGGGEGRRAQGARRGDEVGRRGARSAQGVRAPSRSRIASTLVRGLERATCGAATPDAVAVKCGR